MEVRNKRTINARKLKKKILLDLLENQVGPYQYLSLYNYFPLPLIITSQSVLRSLILATDYYWMEPSFTPTPRASV